MNEIAHRVRGINHAQHMERPVPVSALQERRRILVVEDNPDPAFGLKLNLEVEGYEVLVEGDGARALLLPDVFRHLIILAPRCFVWNREAGWSRRPSRTLDQLRADYLTRLA